MAKGMHAFLGGLVNPFPTSRRKHMDHAEFFFLGIKTKLKVQLCCYLTGILSLKVPCILTDWSFNMSYRFSVCYVYYLLLSESMYVFRQEKDSIFFCFIL